MFAIFEVYIQLILAVVLGAVLGFERHLARKTAGVRTYALVALGATVFSILSEAVADDPGRIAAQVVVGIGFLGAGLIIFKEKGGTEAERVRGLTTAAGLWVSAAIGMAIGFRFYGIAIATTLLTLFVFTILWSLEHRINLGKAASSKDD